VLSGILPEQTGDVMAAYALIDFAEPVIEDGWACLVGTKQN
jgi:ribosomal protein L11 methylase PrmA